MPDTHALKAVAPCVLALSVLAAAVLSSSALIWPESVAGDIVDLAPVHEMRANAALQRLPTSSASRFVAARETRLSLRENVASPTSWLRLAYIDSLGPQGLTDAGRDFLNRSYALAPYGPDDTPWRLRFIFDHWSEVGQPLRNLAIAELDVGRRSHRAEIDNLAADVSDPSGQLAARLALSSRRWKGASD